MPEMKDSGIEWIGEIPSDWDICSLKYNYNLIAGATPDSVNSNMWDGEIKWITPADYKTKDVYVSQGKRNLTELGYKSCSTSLVPAGSIIFSKRAPIGSVAINTYPLCTNQGCLSLTNKNNTVNNKFYYYVLSIYSEVFNLYGSGTTFKEISASVFGNIMLPYPSIFLQNRIVSFLDSKCFEIDALSADIQKEIEILEEYKKSVITEAVTRGLDPNVEMKDSGIRWIGKIPQEWDCTKLKYFATLRSGITLGKTYPQNTELIEVPYLRVANVQGSYVDLNDVATLMALPEEVEKYRLHAGEVLMTEGGDRDKLGRGCVWNGEIALCLHQNHVFAVTTNEEKLLGQFLAFMTASSIARTYFDITAKKTTNLACTNSTTILNFTMPIPPIEEQREIVEYLNKKCGEIDLLIDMKEQFITELENYKKSLIYEYVTGKKEVPE